MILYSARSLLPSATQREYLCMLNDLDPTAVIPRWECVIVVWQWRLFFVRSVIGSFEQQSPEMAVMRESNWNDKDTKYSFANETENECKYVCEYSENVVVVGAIVVDCCCLINTNYRERMEMKWIWAFCEDGGRENNEYIFCFWFGQILG